MSAHLLPQPRALLPNAWASTPRAIGDLHLWATGDPLQASDLNANFLFLLGLIGATQALANAPDAGALDAMELGQELAAKIDTIERHLGEEQRRQTRFGYAPLATVGALKQQLDAIQGPLVAEAQRLHAEVAREDRDLAALGERLEALERAPRPAMPAQLHSLQQALEAARRDVGGMHREILRLREEVYRLRPVAQAYQQLQRQRQGRAEHTIAALGQLTRRVDTLERPQHDAQAAQQEMARARQDAGALRQDVAAQIDQARTDMLRATAALLERIEALERKDGTETPGPG